MSVNTTKFINDVNFDSFFQERILDNNGISVTDINAGLVNLFKTFNENADNFEEQELFFVSDIEDGYPDLVATKSILKNQRFWWWILLLNRLEDPILDIKANWIYPINSTAQILNFINNSNESNNSNNNSRLGRVVELN